MFTAISQGSVGSDLGWLRDLRKLIDADLANMPPPSTISSAVFAEMSQELEVLCDVDRRVVLAMLGERIDGRLAVV
ncbi:MAG: hypothetical protein AAB582_00315 [Patescibacteria group bacterium]